MRCELKNDLRDSTEFNQLFKFSLFFISVKNQAGKGGELTHDETTIIAGALELSEKNARDAMTPISETFSIDISTKFNRDLMQVILGKGHSRVPVYYERPTNIIGLILVLV